MIKKVICIMLVMIGIIMTVTLAEEKEIIIFIDYQELKMTDAKPFIDNNNRTQVPLRVIAEALDADIKWDEENQRITIKKENKSIILTIGENEVSINGKKIIQDTAPMINNGRTYVPVRFISEALGERIFWRSGFFNVIYIDTPKDGVQFIKGEVIEASGFKLKVEEDDEAEMIYIPYEERDDIDYYAGDIIEGTFMGGIKVTKESELVINEKLPYINKLLITVGGHGLYRELDTQLKELEEVLLTNLSQSTVDKIINLFRQEIIQWDEPSILMNWKGGKRTFYDGEYIIEIYPRSVNEYGYTNYVDIDINDKNGYNGRIEAQEEMLEYKQKTNNVFVGVVDYSKEEEGSIEKGFDYGKMCLGERNIKGFKIEVEEDDIADIGSQYFYIKKPSGTVINNGASLGFWESQIILRISISAIVKNRDEALEDMKEVLKKNFSDEIVTSIAEFFYANKEVECELKDFKEDGHELKVVSGKGRWDVTIYFNY